MNKVYCIQQSYIKYNKELRYYEINSYYGRMIKLFANKTDAEQQLLELQYNMFRGLNIFDFERDQWDFCHLKLINTYNDSFNENVDNVEKLQIPENSTNEQIKRFVEFFKDMYGDFLKFYTLIEMEVNE
jgi:hypothetical protein